jgi:F-type H+-transporting ATPase subunit b
MRKIEKKSFILFVLSLFVVAPIYTDSALGASDAPLLSLDNTNFVVSIAFFAFVAILLYLRVPTKITDLLDNREQAIRDEIDGATTLLEESKSLLADLEREHKANILKAEKIVQDAETEAKRLISDSKKEIRLSIERKIKLAEEQIKATEDSVVKSIKDRAIDQAIWTAENQLTETTKQKLNKSITEDSLSRLDKTLNKLFD